MFLQEAWGQTVDPIIYWVLQKNGTTPTHDPSGVREDKVIWIVLKDPQHFLCRKMTPTSPKHRILRSGQKGHFGGKKSAFINRAKQLCLK